MSESGSALQASRPAARADDLVRIAITDPHELVVAGMAELVSTPPDGECARFVLVDAQGSPDVVLYGIRRGDDGGPHDPVLHSLLRKTSATVIATYWDGRSSALEAALSCGARGALSKRLPARHLVEGIHKICRDSRRLGDLPLDDFCHPAIARSGLTPRQLDVLRLIASGLTNPEIAERLFVTINTVKTYIREGYRKIGVTRRSQAVIWAKEHGLTLPEPGLQDVQVAEERVPDLTQGRALLSPVGPGDGPMGTSAGERPLASWIGHRVSRVHAQ